MDKREMGKLRRPGLIEREMGMGANLMGEILEIESMANTCERSCGKNGGVNGFLSPDETQLIYRPRIGGDDGREQKLSALGVYRFDDWGRLISQMEAYFVKVEGILQLSALRVEWVGPAMGELVAKLPRLSGGDGGREIEKIDVVFARGERWAVGVGKQGETVMVGGVDGVELVCYAVARDGKSASEWTRLVEARADLRNNTWKCEKAGFFGKREMDSPVAVVNNENGLGVVSLAMQGLRRFNGVV